MKPLAVTGLGVVAPAAQTADELFAAIAALPGRAETAFGAPEGFDGEAYGGAWVTQIRGFDPTSVLGDKGLRNLDRVTKLFLVAARGALENSGIRRNGEYGAYCASRVGVCGSTAYGSMEAMMELDRVAVLENPRYLNPARFPNTVINSALGYVSIWEDLRALNTTVCNGNCGALDAILLAETYLASSRADAILVGGAEALHEALYLAFDRLGSLARRTARCRPGDAGSRGMRLGEGAAMMTLEREDAAIQRGAPVLARVTGYGTSFEPPESEALLVHMSREALARAMTMALADAGRTADGVDLVVGSSNGVLAYDTAEREAVAAVFGPDVCVTAPKSLFGETLGAAGAFGLAAAMAWLRGAPVHGVISGKVPARVRTVVVGTVGFYGNATAIVVEAPRERQ